MAASSSPTPSGQVLLKGDIVGFTSALRSLVNNSLFSDVKFIVGKEKKEIFAHQCILACRCDVFHGMLSQRLTSNDPKDSPSPFVLPDVQPEVFLAVIEYLYTNCVTINKHIALEVFTSAIEYGLEDLRKLCVQFICETLVVELACEALQAAVTYGQVDMKKKCLAFIEGSTREVVKTRGFHELSDVAMIEILHSDSLMIDEFELIRAVREWAHVNSVVLDKSVPEISKEVVKELRLALLSPEELTSLENDNKKENFIPVERIAETWKFHALKKGSGAPFHLFKRRKGTLSRDHHKYLDLYYK